MSRSARSVVSVSLVCVAVCAVAACKNSGSADDEVGSQSEESTGDGDSTDSGDGDSTDSGDGDSTDSSDGDSTDSSDGDSSDGTLDMPPGPRGCVVHVNQATGSDDNLGLTWVDAKATVQAGLDEAFLREEGCQVWVAEGTYRPTDGGPSDDRDASFTLEPGQHLYGGFSGIELALEQRDWVAHPTILSGDIGMLGDSSDNSRHVVRSEGGGRIDGFEIRDGSSEGSTLLEGRDGAGIYALSGSLTVANAVIVNNRTGPGLDGEIGVIGGHGGNGAGIYMLGGELTLDNVTVASNQTGSGGQGSATGGNGGLGAGLYVDGTLVDIHDSVFSGNQTGDGGNSMGTFGGLGGDGAGLTVFAGALTLDNVTVSASRTGNGGQGGAQGGHGGLGAGLFVVGAVVDIRDCVLSTNQTGDGGQGTNTFGGNGGNGGGAMIIRGSVVIAETVFDGNVTGQGGPGGNIAGSRGANGGLAYVVGEDSSLVLANTEFVANEAASGAGAQLQTSNGPGASVLVVNSVFRANVSDFTSGGLHLLADGSTSVVIANTAIVANQATNAGGGLVYHPLDAIGPEQPRLVNSIVWGNLAQNSGQIFSNSLAQTPLSLLVDATDIEGGCVGVTNDLECVQTHDLDPEFVNLLTGDLHLMPGSALLDLGLAEHLPPDLADLDEDGDLDEPTPLDFDNLARVVGTAPDIGPLEMP
jgi:hypothetical protein